MSAKNWRIRVNCVMAAGKLSLVCEKQGAIGLDASCEEIVWEFNGVPAGWQPGIKFPGGNPPGMTSFSNGTNTITLRWPTGGVGTTSGKTPWCRKHQVFISLGTLKYWAEEQQLAVASKSTVQVSTTAVDVPNLVLLANPQVTWDFSSFTSPPTTVTFEFVDESGTKTPTGPFSKIDSVGTSTWVGTWDAKNIGHYKYDIIVDSIPLPFFRSTERITIDPVLDYLPPPATYPIAPPFPEERKKRISRPRGAHGPRTGFAAPGRRG
ncbi:MAG TPA: hypothetical protein VFE33_19625 [Thermoanaerobaculia bacterium]|nr:hypothetical protein [Thermoanaerobaculia bacterium]